MLGLTIGTCGAVLCMIFAVVPVVERLSTKNKVGTNDGMRNRADETRSLSGYGYSDRLTGLVESWRSVVEGQEKIATDLDLMKGGGALERPVQEGPAGLVASSMPAGD